MHLQLWLYNGRDPPQFHCHLAGTLPAVVSDGLTWQQSNRFEHELSRSRARS